MATTKIDGEADVLAAIGAMHGSDREIGEQLHKIITTAAPELTMRTWYGMPAYVKDGKVLCFFRSAARFKERYLLFGFNDSANLDNGNMWPTNFAVTKVTDTEAARITELVKQAVK